ncbi:MAG: MFS transporter [Candidatus Bathyarchaeia archaeon]
MTGDDSSSGSYRWVVLMIAWLSYTAVYMVRMTASPLTPFIAGDLKLSLTEVGLLTSASAIGYTVAQTPAGWLADRIGVRKMLFIGTFSAGVFALFMLVAQSLASVLVILFLIGLGCGCFPTTAMKAIVQWFQVKERGTAIGINQTAMNLAGILTASTLPALALSLGWRAAFIATGVISIGFAFVSYLLYREKASASTPIESERGSSASWDKLKSVMLDRNILFVSLSALGLCTVEFSLIAYLVVFLKASAGMTVAVAAGFLALANGGGAIGKPFFGAISDRVFGGSRRKPLLLVAATVALTSTLMQVITPSTPYSVLAIVFTVFGFGAIGWAGLNFVLVSEFASADVTGLAVGYSVTINLLGNIFGPPIFGFIVDSTGAYTDAWWFLTFSAIVSFLLMLAVRESSRRV